MATVVLQTVGAAVGQFLGGPIGAIIGQTVGAVAGSAIDQRLFGPKAPDGPRLNTMPALASTEGAPIPVVYGRARVGGQVIWATRFEETTSRGSGGGKGVGGKKPKTFNYFANFAVGLCEGPVGGVRRIWADGRELDQTRFTLRIYDGSETQQADPLIVAKEGADNAPAYRGLAYVVFERMPLADFGNRIPQLSFEVIRPTSRLATMIRGVDIIPGAGESVYAKAPVFVRGSLGSSVAENRNTLLAATDFTASMNALEQTLPNAKSAALVVSWFGDDLRAGACTIAPRVEGASRQPSSRWSVAGVERGRARAVSAHDGKPAYGGTPSDADVIAAIGDLRARGLSVVFYPFVMMDVPAMNSLPDPWSGGASQPAYPWRGRITCDPAPGRAGSPDGATGAAAQVGAFFGSATPGAGEWSYRRFILHYAHLCARAGGVDAFLIGSELPGLTRVRAAAGVYPAVDALTTLAADVKAIVGAACKVSYAADWTEYGAHVPGDGAEVRFPLDKLWAAPAVDFVGIDFYAPLSDWRDGDRHLDAAEATSVYDPAYLRRRVAGGEAFDWFYRDAAARAAQTRSPIVDGLRGQHWMFRQKDLLGWWSNPHVERVGGVEAPARTAWVPSSKPIWLVEIGCPAVDRGANAPNVFPDPKSSESALPHFSCGHRDDLMQARGLEALISRFDPAADGFEDIFNPVSPLYGGRMVDPARIHVWAWDARPWPAFPQRPDVWSDCAQWATGHWINGRVEGASLDVVIGEICARTPGIDPRSVRPHVAAWIDGFIIDRPMSARRALEPLADLFAFDGVVSGGAIRFEPRGRARPRVLSEDDVAPDEGGVLHSLTRAQESELPRRLALSFHDGEREYRPASVHSRRLETGSARELSTDVPIVLTRAQAQHRCDVALQDVWSARERMRMRLRPGLLDVEVGDVIALPGAPERLFRVGRTVERGLIEIDAHGCEPAIYDHAPPRLAPATLPAERTAGPARVDVLDLALVRPGLSALQYAAVYADPWPGAFAVWRRVGESFEFERLIESRAVVGETLDPLGPGVTSRYDRANSLRVRFSGALSSLDEAAALSGANALAIRGQDGAWEAFLYADAELVERGVYRLSRLVRGLGQDELSRRTVPAGAAVVLLNEAVVPLVTDVGLIGSTCVWRFAPASTDFADDLAVEVAAPVSALALRPLAPVRARARRFAEGVAITFIRRGRIDADGWGLAEIPLGEDAERYRIDVLGGGDVKRTLIAEGAPRAIYMHELADFGAQQATLSVRIAQISPVVGDGFSRTFTLPIN